MATLTASCKIKDCKVTIVVETEAWTLSSEEKAAPGTLAYLSLDDVHSAAQAQLESWIRSRSLKVEATA